jgi:hypothetical protein
MVVVSSGGGDGDYDHCHVTNGVGPGSTRARPKGQLEHEPALGPPKRGRSGNLATRTLALEVQARAARGPRSSGPARGQSIRTKPKSGVKRMQMVTRK